MKRLIAPLAAVLCSACMLAGCVTQGAGMPPLETVDEVDVERYMGRWYEVARYQHTFEKRLVGVTAEYTLREDGRVRVVNSGFRDDLDGPYRQAKAVAWVPDPAEPGALKVRFFWPFASDYLIFGLDEEYRWALVGNQSRDFLWFLARDHEISPELFSEMKMRASDAGFDLSGLYEVPQKPRENR